MSRRAADVFQSRIVGGGKVSGIECSRGVDCTAGVHDSCFCEHVSCEASLGRANLEEI